MLIKIFALEYFYFLWLFPVFGAILSLVKNIKYLKILLIISIACLSPAFTGYKFVIDWFYGFWLTIILSLCYTEVLKLIQLIAARITLTILTPILLIVIIGFFSFIDAMGGGEDILSTHYSKGYKIEKVENYGFSGQHLFLYRLSVAPLNGLFYKELDRKKISIDNLEDNFIFKFEEADVWYDIESKNIILENPLIE
jgi:hypothetical protein